MKTNIYCSTFSRFPFVILPIIKKITTKSKKKKNNRSEPTRSKMLLDKVTWLSEKISSRKVVHRWGKKKNLKKAHILVKPIDFSL